MMIRKVEASSEYIMASNTQWNGYAYNLADNNPANATSTTSWGYNFNNTYATGGNVYKTSMNLTIIGNPTGNIYMAIYNITSAQGLPTGNAIWSNPKDVSTLTNNSFNNFTWSGNNSLSFNTSYALCITGFNATYINYASDYIKIIGKNTYISPWNGTYYRTNWIVDQTGSIQYYVYGLDLVQTDVESWYGTFKGREWLTLESWRGVLEVRIWTTIEEWLSTSYNYFAEIMNPFGLGGVLGLGSSIPVMAYGARKQNKYIIIIGIVLFFISIMMLFSLASITYDIWI